MGLYMIKKTENNLLRKNRCVFNPFVNASHTDAERHYFGKDHPFPCERRSLSHGNTRASLHCGPRSRITFTLKSPSGLFKVSYLGSVRAVTNQWGSPLYMFDYDVFGQPLQDRPERFRHGFTGKEYDSWTGLYNYGFRDYSATFGRFTSVDPIRDGHNWYAYVNSDPVSWLDPWGLKGQESGGDVKNNFSITRAVDKIKGIFHEAGERIHEIKHNVKEDSAQFLKNETTDILVMIPEDGGFYTTPESLINKGPATYDSVHMDGIYNVTTGQLVKIPNGYSVIVEKKSVFFSKEKTKYHFVNSVDPHKKKEVFLSWFGTQKVIEEDEIKNNPNEANWLKNDLVKEAIDSAKKELEQ